MTGMKAFALLAAICDPGRSRHRFGKLGAEGWRKGPQPEGGLRTLEHIRR
jgi:hypothetical protein